MTIVDELYATIGDGLRMFADIIDSPATPLHDYDEPVINEAQPCACGAGYPSVSDCPWCAPEPPLTDDELVAVRQLIEERFGDQTSRAAGLQRASTPGEVSGVGPLSSTPPTVTCSTRPP